MRFLWWALQVQKVAKPLPGELVTALSQFAEMREGVLERLEAVELNVRETRTRLETVYRKVYRDAAKESEPETVLPVMSKKFSFPDPLRPGDGYREV